MVAIDNRFSLDTRFITSYDRLTCRFDSTAIVGNLNMAKTCINHLLSCFYIATVDCLHG
jgi:hypothetical protein